MHYFLVENKPLSVEIIVSNFGGSYPHGKVHMDTIDMLESKGYSFGKIKSVLPP
ncbi:MAG: hypothetical protein QXX64_01745 [Nitrososphaera sp.]|uniref:Uncharacterized protein n=1 Tax=Nitrososphaera gargensis (strain Ga9.2) TaxID=1237085 RepID=K0IF06_NITGG|nr:hypothetical protein [Candidatus Nitrososphaera gargensis]AFU57383.1 hypothetical protein Ngar_c04360 [Candidatus Nitrososphaera gargensis Ga9.2]